MSNRLDPDQAQHNVRPDLGPNCLQRLSADDKMSYTAAIQSGLISKLFIEQLYLLPESSDGSG